MTGNAQNLRSPGVLKTVCMMIAAFNIFMFVGCVVNVRSGGQEISQEVTQIFQTYQILPDHRYYHIGWDTRPYAIVGLKAPYHMTSKYWFEFEANSKTLKKRVDALEIFIERGYNRVNGYYILDTAGNRIGVWYSSISIFSASANDADQTVAITMDRPWVTGDRRGL